MTPRRAFYAMILLIVVTAGGIIAVIVLGNSILQDQSRQLVDLKLENAVLEQQQTGLIKAKSDIAKYSNLEEITQNIVPQDKDQARAVREIVSLAAQSGIALKSFIFASSNLGNKAPAGSDTTAKTPSVSQAKPVEGIKGVYSVEVSIMPQNRVSYPQFINFLQRLEKNRRTSQVSQIKINPGDTSARTPSIDFSLNVNIFVKP